MSSKACAGSCAVRFVLHGTGFEPGDEPAPSSAWLPRAVSGYSWSKYISCRRPAGNAAAVSSAAMGTCRRGQGRPRRVEGRRRGLWRRSGPRRRRRSARRYPVARPAWRCPRGRDGDRRGRARGKRRCSARCKMLSRANALAARAGLRRRLGREGRGRTDIADVLILGKKGHVGAERGRSPGGGRPRRRRRPSALLLSGWLSHLGAARR